MSVLEVRRHSLRKPGGGGSQLSQAGVDLARQVGAGLGPFRTVAATVSPRTRETAVAMGFAVDHELVPLADEPGDLHDPVPWYEDPRPYAAVATVLRRDETYRHWAVALANLWRDLLTPLGPDEAALYVGHGGQLELGLVAAFPAADHASWGPVFAPLDGARLTFDGVPARFLAVEFVRGPAATAYGSNL